ncbi:hypothetical protein GM658_11995 [Pseudoduganella eburnea]|uniref:Tetratricopeptide repeat protein n=1 Tax=Massilia eburnea TaxID=1776165 RepID=A0A6L6QI45_9BURK|nr:hypothetical protein [Massilia eburnea]MTW11316.1 hypothetical protein [Massilia eburnea]
MMFHKAFITFICAVHFNSHAATNTDASALSAPKQALYSDIEKTLNDWSGENSKIVIARAKIDSFIHSDPDFLPVYIEKARLTILLGSTGGNDYGKANREALKILAEIQKKDPAYPKSYVLAGHAYLNLGDFENARKSLDYAERLGTADPWLPYNWADFYRRQKQYDKALSYGRKALILSKDNSKALLAAAYLIDQTSKLTAQPTQGVDVTEIVFASFKDPEQRMRIATRMTGGASNNSVFFDRAYEIIERQGQETPGLEAVQLAKAEWLLKKGYRRHENAIAKYDPRFSSAAEKILDSIPPSKTANGRIFSNKFAIALSNGDNGKAGKLLVDARASDIPSSRIRASEAMLMWQLKGYQAVIDILENLEESDKSRTNDELLMAAYERAGHPEMLAAYYKKQLDLDPSSAWNWGNYAGILLHINDVDGAIKYGEESLKIMKYPIAENITALAHLIKASLLKKSGKTSLANAHFDRARSIGLSKDFALEYCGNYCAEVSEMLARP